MATTATSLTGLGNVADCHQRGSGSNPQLGTIPDLETISSSGQQQVTNALTPPPQLPSSPWYYSAPAKAPLSHLLEIIFSQKNTSSLKPKCIDGAHSPKSPSCNIFLTLATKILRNYSSSNVHLLSFLFSFLESNMIVCKQVALILHRSLADFAPILFHPNFYVGIKLLP